MKRILFILCFVFGCGLVSFAQKSESRMEFSVVSLYSLNQNLMSEEFSLAYKWDNGILKANFECYDLANAENVFGESVSLISKKANPTSDFTVRPEVGAGIVHGRFSGTDDVSVKSQIFLGATLNYSLGRYLDTGILMRYCLIGNNIWNYSIGFNFTVKF